MKKFLQIVSGILHPLLLPSLGIVLLFQLGSFRELPWNYKLYVESMVFLNTGVIPAIGIWLLKKSGHISDLDVSSRSERFFPYLISILATASACIMLFRSQMPWWVVKLFIGSVLATIVALLITIKWKVSAHAMAFGCLLGSAFLVCIQLAVFPLIPFSALVLLAGLQASSRLYLGKHTPGQVVVGLLLGVVSVQSAFFLIP